VLLATRSYPINDIRRFVFEYELPQGFTLTSVSATITPSTATSTVGQQTLSPDEKCAWIWVNFGTVVNETFTLNVSVTDNFGERFNDIVNFTLVSAGA